MTLPPRHKIYDNVIETIGGTPLVRLNKIPVEAGCNATILAKLEFFNPLCSVKDRTALGMIEAAEAGGFLKTGGTLVEATSGNTGIGLAFIAAVKGYHLILTMPDNMSLERRKLLGFLGAEIVLTPAAEGMAGAVRKAEEIAQNNADAFMPHQFDNPSNPAIHATTTAREIWEDTDGNVDAFVAGVGTGGTLQGVAAQLRICNHDVKIIGIQPASCAVLSGGAVGPHNIQGIGPNFVPSILDLQIIDEIVSVTDDDAMTYARLLARKEGIMGGISSGAAVAAAVKLGKRREMAGKTIVTLLPDSAERYLSTPLFEG